jgi:flagellar hook-associated protein 3 FlgL
MISSLDSGTQHFLSSVDRVQRRLADANQQVTSGKRVNVASDAPDEISAILQYRAELSRNQQVRANLALAKTGADAADQSLSASIKLLDRARVLATQAGNPTMDAAGRRSIANEVRSLQEQMVAQSRTAVQGRFIFSGSNDLNPVYALDLSSPTGVTQLNDASATIQIEDPAGGAFGSTKTAQEIFDSRNPDDSVAPGNVFAALNSLRVALENNDDSALNAASLSLRARCARDLTT